jgi:two-component system, NtrC family, response regulator AtoC
MDKLNILVVEDDKLAQKVMAAQLGAQSADFADDYKSALKKLETGAYDLGFFDLMLGPDDDYSGLKLVAKASEKGLYAVVVSSSDSDEHVSRAYELGAADFYSKGNEERNVASILRRFLQERKAAAAPDVFASAFVTRDPETRAAAAEALKYAPTDLPVMLLGPSGTGKTSFARIIHERSGRQGAFVAVNCAAYTEDLLEAELFGYRKGAFTGATESRRGRLLEAHGGTLFLDELGAMSHGMQTKLLKALEEKCFHPLGAERPEKSDFRIISATLEDPQDLIARGRLRFDLFHRVHGYTFTLKPLSRRACDIFPLLEHFTRGGRRLAFTPEAKRIVEQYSWPGNIRELRKFADLVSAGERGLVTPQAVERLLRGAGPGRCAAEPGLYELALRQGLDAALDKVSSEIILRNLRENNNKRTQVLQDLKISTRLLYATLKKAGIDGGEAL